MRKAIGRPPKYGDDILDKTREYITQSEDGNREVNLPTIEGLAFHLKVAKETIYDWRGKYVPFSDLISELLAKQGQRLVNKGLAGTYNPTIAKVLLTKHGYREGVEHTGAEGEKLFDDETLKKAQAAISEIVGK